MNYVSHISIILAVLVAYWTIKFSERLIKLPEEKNHYESIDGVRGYLGVLVYLHHACTWYFYLKSGKWEFTPISFYTTLGQGCMVFIFMITGFLFFGKIIDSKGKSINWGKFLYFRIFRLIPMYMFSVFLMVLLVFYSSNWIFIESAIDISAEVMNWLVFTIFSSPNINDFKETSIVVAGVTWTMPYEWCFYLILPAIAFSFLQKVPIKYLILSTISIIYAFSYHLHWIAGLSFFCGMLSAKLVRFDTVKVYSSSRWASWIALMLITVLAIFFKTSYEAMPVMILGIVFLIISGGNSLFGTLVNKSARRMGQIGYSIYLLHGIFLYTIFAIIFGKTFSATLNPYQHWSIILLSTPVLMLLSKLTFKWIEYPSMQIARRTHMAFETRGFTPNISAQTGNK